jgi:hypothetical protein
VPSLPPCKPTIFSHFWAIGDEWWRFRPLCVPRCHSHAPASAPDIWRHSRDLRVARRHDRTVGCPGAWEAAGTQGLVLEIGRGMDVLYSTMKYGLTWIHHEHGGFLANCFLQFSNPSNPGWEKNIFDKELPKERWQSSMKDEWNRTVRHCTGLINMQGWHFKIPRVAFKSSCR